MLNPRSIAVGGVGYGARAVAVLGLWPSERLPEDDGVFDAPYQAYVKRINVERSAPPSVTKNDVAIHETSDYDSRVGRGAPGIGAVQALPDVAPTLNNTVQAIRIQGVDLTPIPNTAFSRQRIASDDEAAIMALFMLMADDD